MIPEAVPEDAGDTRPISDEEHEAFSEVVRRHAGIKLGENKRQLLASRLQKRMRRLHIVSYADYHRYLMSHMEQELPEFINSLTTNLTAFFREDHHFVYLRRHFDGLPAGARLRIWSAGCATGEEPYSVGMVFRESAAPARGVSMHVVATDIDTECIGRAEKGIYELAAAKGLDDRRLARHFLKGRGANVGKIRVRPDVREFVSFHHMNLLSDWEVDAPFDIILCRNVVIYFDDAAQKALFHRFAEALKPDGLLFIGHSENLLRVSDRFRSIGQTIYRRVK